MYIWVSGSGREASVGGKVPISLENDLGRVSVVPWLPDHN
jgi:hypothetical protein